MTDDQDFFFDEEETVVEEKPVAAPKAKTTTAVSTTAPAGVAVPAGDAQSVTMTVAALIGVVALLVGVIIGIVIPVGGSTGTVPQPTTPGTNATAPQLSEDQLQGGELPQGHPDISGMATDTATGTPAP
ncbi:MAG: hypothetical protein ACYC6C_01620 [Coriobacteriia bacterium]